MFTSATRTSTKMEIIRALGDPNINMVGMYGSSGVGKTTMAREIITDVVRDGLFHEVTMAVASVNVINITIQVQLAEMLGLEIDGNKELPIARQLHGRLTSTIDNEKKILVVLDDLWREIDLGTLGIPSPREGLKVLLTSPYKDVCKNMGAKMSTFEVGELPKSEAFLLFQEVAGISASDQVKDIAEKVVEMCGGLPLYLNLIGSSLKDAALATWDDVLDDIQNHWLKEVQFARIGWSYFLLEHDEHSALLSLCSLFTQEERIPIETLFRYAWGVNLFKKCTAKTLSENRNQIYSILDYLKSRHFLLSSWKNDEVGMHHVIRDFCLSVANDYHQQRYHKLAISVTLFGREDLPASMLSNEKNLKLLRMVDTSIPYSSSLVSYSRRYQLKNMFGRTLYGMKELEAVHFSNIRILSSIQFPVSLRILCLDHCWIESQISFFWSFKNLEILTFFSSFLRDDIERDIKERLTNLRLLDLRFAYGPSVLPSGLLSGMTNLEELYLGHIFGETNDIKKHIIKEARSMKALNTLQVCTDDARFLMQLMQVLQDNELERFHIATDGYPIKFFSQFTRSLRLEINADHPSELSEDGFTHLKKLMKKSDYIYLSIKGLENLVTQLDEDGFTHLKILELFESDFEYLIDDVHSIREDTFRKLESLDLRFLHNLKEICNVKQPGLSAPPLFDNLRVITLRHCFEIKSVFRETVANGMANLQELTILDCPMLEQVISIDAPENAIITQLFEFPNLKRVELDNLSRFKSFRSQSNAAHQTLIDQVILPNLDSLKIETINQEMLFHGEQLKSLQNLRELSVRLCENMSILFDFESLTVTNDFKESFLSQLRLLDLYHLPKLVHITMKVYKGISVFKNLKFLRVAECRKLRYLFSTSTVKSLEALETLIVSHCEELEEIIGGEDEEDSSKIDMVKGMDSEIVFPKLQSINLLGLPRYKTFCSQNYELVFPSLDNLEIPSCPAGTKFCSGKLIAPKLPRPPETYNFKGILGSILKQSNKRNRW